MVSELTKLLDSLKDINEVKDNVYDLKTKEGHDKAVDLINSLDDTPLFDLFLGKDWREEVVKLCDSIYDLSDEKEEKKELPLYIDIIKPEARKNIIDIVKAYYDEVICNRADVKKLSDEQKKSVNDLLLDFAAWMFQR